MSWRCVRCGLDQAFEGNDVCGVCREQIYAEEAYEHERQRLAEEAELERQEWERLIREGEQG